MLFNEQPEPTETDQMVLNSMPEASEMEPDEEMENEEEMDNDDDQEEAKEDAGEEEAEG